MSEFTSLFQIYTHCFHFKLSNRHLTLVYNLFNVCVYAYFTHLCIKLVISHSALIIQCSFLFLASTLYHSTFLVSNRRNMQSLISYKHNKHTMRKKQVLERISLSSQRFRFKNPSETVADRIMPCPRPCQICPNHILKPCKYVTQMAKETLQIWLVKNLEMHRLFWIIWVGPM